MINLIPPVARRSIIREYWIRAVTVWMFLLGTGCLIVTCLLLPTYMLVRNEIDALALQVEQNSARVANFDVSSNELVTAGRQAAVLAAPQTDTAFSIYYGALLDLAGSAVTVETMTFTRVATTTTISVTGVAATRQALATFRDEIKSQPMFIAADLPISSLIKDRDLLFTLSVVAVGSSTAVTP
jgi:hypothetical protein